MSELHPLHLPLRTARVVAFSPDGRRLAAGGDDPKVVIVDANSGELLAEMSGFDGPDPVVGLQPRRPTPPDRGSWIRLSGSGTRLPAGSVRTFAGHSLEVLAAVFHPDGTRIASGGHDRSILIWDTATGDELVRLPGHTSYVFSLAFSPDGETLVSGSGDSTVRLWDAFPVARRLRSRRTAEGDVPKGSLPDQKHAPRRL